MDILGIACGDISRTSDWKPGLAQRLLGYRNGKGRNMGRKRMTKEKEVKIGKARKLGKREQRKAKTKLKKGRERKMD
jgi:hypothetical protein